MAERSSLDALQHVAPAAIDKGRVIFPRTGQVRHAGARPGAADASLAERIALAEMVVRFRAIRQDFLNPVYFGEAAFDMLLDLYVSHMRGSVVYQNDAYIASMVPATTAYRWLLALERDGLVALRSDPDDRRRGIVELTAGAVSRVEAMLDAWVAMRPAGAADPVS